MKMYKKIIKTFWILILFIAIGCNEDNPFGGNNPQSGYVDLESESLFIEESGVIIIPVNLDTSINLDGVDVMYTIESLGETLPNGLIDNTGGKVTIQPGEVSSEINLTIPDNDFEYSFKVALTGTNDSDFTIGIRDNSKITSTNVTVRSCPISVDYLVGTYMLNSPPANIFCAAPRPPFIGDGVEVEVSIGNSPNQRVFEARYSPISCDGFNGPYQFTIELDCGEAFLANSITTGVSCNGGATLIVIDNDPDRVSNYNINDDSSITVNVIDDINGSCTSCCGAPFANQSFTLTKL